MKPIRNETGIINNPDVFNLIHDGSPDDIVREKLLQEFKDDQRIKILMFRVTRPKVLGIYSFRRELITALNCKVHSPYFNTQKVVLTGLRVISFEELDSALSAIKLFCVEHSCEFIGFTLLEDKSV